jgi:hypothetical protein
MSYLNKKNKFLLQGNTFIILYTSILISPFALEKNVPFGCVTNIVYPAVRLWQ